MNKMAGKQIYVKINEHNEMLRIKKYAPSAERVSLSQEAYQSRHPTFFGKLFFIERKTKLTGKEVADYSRLQYSNHPRQNKRKQKQPPRQHTGLLRLESHINIQLPTDSLRTAGIRNTPAGANARANILSKDGARRILKRL